MFVIYIAILLGIHTYVLFIIADVLNSGIWSEFNFDTDNKYLTSLHTKLKDTVLIAKASSTTSKYSGGWRRWKDFAHCHQLQVFPVKPVDLALYIQHVANHSISPAPIDTAIYGIRWAHMLAGVISPTDSSFIKTVVEGCRRALAKPKVPKEPISVDALSKLVMDKGANPSMYDMRLLFICLVSFAGLLRCDEITSIKICDISFFSDHMSIYLPKRKNDQFRQGHTVFIARTGNSTCPVAITERYIDMLGIANSPSHPLVCGFRRSKRAGLGPISKAITYSTVRDLIKSGLSKYVDDPSSLGTHSLRSGGASAAASANVSERCLTRQGGWKSTSSKDMYIKDSIDNKLSVSRAMKL